MAHASADMRAMLLKSLNGKELSTDEGLAIYTATGDHLRAVIKAADLARAEDVGEEVTYVVNRNINFTNICFVGCQFCGFKRQRSEGACVGPCSWGGVCRGGRAGRGWA